MKRGYLLPEGCKDLSDVLKLKRKDIPDILLRTLPVLPTVLNETLKPSKQTSPLPPISGQVFTPPQTTVRQLAALLGQKPFQIIGDIMLLGVFATADSMIDFKTISEVARMHGFMAIKVD